MWMVGQGLHRSSAIPLCFQGMRVCNTKEEETCRIKVVVQGQVLSLLHGDSAGRTDKGQEAVEDETRHC